MCEYSAKKNKSDIFDINIFMSCRPGLGVSSLKVL